MGHGLLLFFILFAENSYALYGKVVKQAKEKFVVSLSLDENHKRGFEDFCSGVLISPTKVLTAGHCINGIGHMAYGMSMALVYRPYHLFIEVGDEVIEASSVTYSPDYFESRFFDGEDLALIHLSKVVKFVKPIKITDRKLISGLPLTLIARERKVETKLTEARTFGNAGVLFLDSAAGACAGDSGGAVVVQEKSGEPELAGILMYAGKEKCERKTGHAYFPKVQF